MLAIKPDTRYRFETKESNTQRFERNLLKQSRKQTILFFTLRTTCYLPLSLFNFISLLNFFFFPSPQFYYFPSSTIFIISPSSMFFIPSLHLHLLIYSIYFSIHKYIDLLATLHRPHIDPTSTPHRPYIDPTLNFFFKTAS